MDKNIFIKFYDKINDDKIKNNVWKILCECDKEFYPPLSERKTFGSLLDLNCKAKVKDKLPYDYFKSMIKQNFLIAYMDNRYIVGFMAFLSNVNPNNFNIKCNYYTTLCVRKANRQKGIATGLLTFELKDSFKSEITLTRTWSLNYPIIKSLKKAGFRVKKMVANDRDNGIDTIYFEKIEY
jgi:ribosomal protein S18 acetylase RimI-like enzyme